MYAPKHFEQQRPEVLRALMAAYPLAAVVTTSDSGIEANHIPLLFDAQAGGNGLLLGHIARGNGQWKNWGAEQSALAIFQGPQAYISPNWYPTKHENGRAVPTWNYAVVHAHGTIHVHDDPEWLRGFLDRLTATHEASEELPWKPSDAPGTYIDGLLKAIVGVELRITRLEGKWKVSQNQPEANRTGVADALQRIGHPDMAEAVLHSLKLSLKCDST